MNPALRNRHLRLRGAARHTTILGNAKSKRAPPVARSLPARSVPLVTRELVYTAITRAKQRLSLYADEQVLSQAIVTRTERRSGLAEIFAGREAP